MCGIIGFSAPSMEAAQKTAYLRKMMKLIQHRGPDDAGIYVDEDVAFGHQRLSIIDVSNGHQPMSRDGVTLVFNGEIYNYKELKESLQAKGYTFTTSSDTEVVLVMYLEFGSDMFAYLEGMFAIGVWEKAKKQMILAVDHIGIKPLYYSYHESNIIFCSELKGILAYPQFPRKLNAQALHEYMHSSYYLGNESLIKGVNRLQPGSFLKWVGNEMSIHTYWESSPGNYHFDSFDDCKQALKEIFAKSVRSHMVSDVEVGAYLSGGIDSSAIVAVADQVSHPIKTFSVGFPDSPDFDESAAAQLVSSIYGTNHHAVTFTANHVIEDMEKIVWLLDEPIVGAGVLPNFYVSKLASQHVKVVLGGQGGDELFGGYARHVFFGPHNNKLKIVQQLLNKFALKRSKKAQHAEPQVQANVQKQLSKKTIMSILKGIPSWLESFIARYYKHSLVFTNLDEVLSSDIRKQVARSNLDLLKQIDHANHKEALLNRMLLLDLQTYLRGYLQLEDRMSMAWSLESRVPFLSKEMIEFALAIPAKWKINGLTTKYIFKKAVSDLLPNDILNKKKMGFPVPIADWFNRELKSYVSEICLSDKALTRNIVNPDYVKRLLATPPAFQDRMWDRKVWKILNVELWARQFLDYNPMLDEEKGANDGE